MTGRIQSNRKGEASVLGAKSFQVSSESVGRSLGHSDVFRPEEVTATNQLLRSCRAVIVGDGTLVDSQIHRLLEAGCIVILVPGSIVSTLAGHGDPEGERHYPSAENDIIWDALRIDLVHHRAYWQEQWLPLTDQELRILASLAIARDRAVSYSRLSREVWSSNYMHCGDSLRSALKRLRSKLARRSASVRIEAIRGFGLRLCIDSTQGAEKRLP